MLFVEGGAGKSPHFLCLGETDKRVMLADRRRVSGAPGIQHSATREASCQV